MANLLPLLTILPHCLNSEAIKLSKLITLTRCYSGKKGTHCVKKMNLGRHQFFREGISVPSNAQHLELKIFSGLQSSVDQIVPSLDTSEIEELEKRYSFLFRTEIGGQVKVYVGRKNMKYAVFVEVSSLPQWNSEDKLVLSWVTYRSDPSCLTTPDTLDSAPGTRSNSIQTPFKQTSFGKLSVQLDFESNQAPFYISFLLLHSSVNAALSESELRSHRKTKFCVPVLVGAGYHAPLGISFSNDGSLNFALFSRNAKSVVLCLFDEMTDKPSLEIDLDPYVNRTGDIWHVSMESFGPFLAYGYRCKDDLLLEKSERFHADHVLLDPYAKILKSVIPNHSGPSSRQKFFGCLCKEPTFDWSGDISLCFPLENLMVYRLNVGRFTEDKSSELPNDIAGTFAGLVEKLHHFKSLGVNAILLEPIFPFDKQRGPYFPFHFFSTMNSYRPDRDALSAIISMKEMVKRLHANGIEVLLEVVFSHTAEFGGPASRALSLQGIDCLSYYVINGNAESGSWNVLNCNNPIVQQLVLDSLRYWVTEFHIDGFCFINASSLLIGTSGENLLRPPLVEAIAFDPILSRTKFIADFWDPSDMEPMEIRFPHWKRWAQMNTNFCHDVRNFLRGEGLLSNLATRLCGSGDIFSDGRGPAFSFNFIARNFGLSLLDLVCFSSSKLSLELSWNCGEEGPTNKTVILERRLKQIRNFLFILYISLGVPVLNMGDECGHTSGGSPSYTDRKSFDWGTLKTGFGFQMTQFIAFLGSLRLRRSDLLRNRNFMKEENIEWHGTDLSQPRWDDPSNKFLAVTLKTDRNNSRSSLESSDMMGDLYIAFNADDHSESVMLPLISEGMAWLRLIDTALPFPGFFSMEGDRVHEQMADLIAYEVKAHSCALFEAKCLIA